jgi:carbohydrate-binding DOMON domain-containing protein
MITAIGRQRQDKYCGVTATATVTVTNTVLEARTRKVVVRETCAGPRSPPKPPRPRMKSEDVLMKYVSPASSFVVTSTTTSAA